ncbi:hypothetical protein ACOMHN_058940 [Nucella lapillus]
MMATHSVHLLCFLSILLSQFHVSYASDSRNGMTSRLFKGFPSLQEITCSGHKLQAEVKLLSLQLFRLPENELLASLNGYSQSCVTLGGYSSCVVDSQNTHQSELRVLVTDLKEGESKEYKCTANTVDSYGFSKILTWITTVTRLSEY